MQKYQRYGYRLGAYLMHALFMHAHKVEGVGHKVKGERVQHGRHEGEVEPVGGAAREDVRGEPLHPRILHEGVKILILMNPTYSKFCL